jgi:hypothetical protein
LSEGTRKNLRFFILVFFLVQLFGLACVHIFVAQPKIRAREAHVAAGLVLGLTTLTAGFWGYRLRRG